MKLSPEQLAAYEEDGFLLLENVFSDSEVDTFVDEIERLKDIDTPSRVLEESSGLVRALHGCHLDSVIFGELIRKKRMLDPAVQILGDDVYVFQFKVNCKEAFGGEVWKWHQDYILWKYEDQMPEPLATNHMIFLDEVTEFNGPLIVIPGSHKDGCIDRKSNRSETGAGDWEENVSADLKYTLDGETVARMTVNGGMVAPKGPRGSVLLFHPNLAHGSAPNISPIHRRLLIVTYNRTDNAPQPEHLWRPEFLVGRDTSPLVSTGD